MAGIRSSAMSSPYRSASAWSSRLGHDLRPQPVHQTTASLRSAGSGMRYTMASPAPHPGAAQRSAACGNRHGRSVASGKMTRWPSTHVRSAAPLN